jgi:transposase
MNTASKSVVGIDVSKSKLDVTLLADGKQKNKVVLNTKQGYKELAKWVERQGVQIADVHACMESTGVYSEPVAFGLLDLGFKVSIVNPASVKGFGQSLNVRNKNDAVDACVIARFCVAIDPALWVPPTPQLRQLRAWHERLGALKEMRQQEFNRIEALEFAEHSDVAKNVKTHMAWLDEQIAKVKKDIDDLIDDDPDLKRDADLIESIPGIARTTAAKVLARVGNLRRFGSAKELAAYIGVTPRQRQSGTSVRGRTTMSRMGSGELRTALYMPALTAIKRNALLADFAVRLRSTGMAHMAVIGAVMRKLVHQMYGVIRTGKPFDPNYLAKRLAIQDGI